MQISQNGIDLIKGFEGCSLSAYNDGTGTPTIGYGHIENVKYGQTITQEQAEEMLRNDLLIYGGYVQKLIDNKVIQFEVNQNMFDALTSFVYNLGFSNLTTLVTNRDMQTVSEKMLLYVNANGSVWEGLVRRRTAERDLFLKPCEIVSRETISHSEFSQEYDEIGVATICVDKLNIRDYPSTSKGNIVGSYFYGEQFCYSHVIINEGFVWCRYVSFSGKTRFVAVKELEIGKRYANCI